MLHLFVPLQLQRIAHGARIDVLANDLAQIAKRAMTHGRRLVAHGPSQRRTCHCRSNA